ncbi:hypothetical protein [Breznakiella homolactica]|uniref:Uncharacterized protein n=1 Tax=Breznakiella homolactica TaxID=2798577 RepID=A0A7T7XQ84_9SPIR|nr:hypothetical protein [Breznakiella homolactica]QQO10529.1 hypothetical protein JFL75_06335 [Breznakiella homolactica]
MERNVKKHMTPREEIIDFYKLVSKSRHCTFDQVRDQFASLRVETMVCDISKSLRQNISSPKQYNEKDIKSDDMYNLMTRDYYGNHRRNSF